MACSRVNGRDGLEKDWIEKGRHGGPTIASVEPSPILPSAASCFREGITLSCIPLREHNNIQQEGAFSSAPRRVIRRALAYDPSFSFFRKISSKPGWSRKLSHLGSMRNKGTEKPKATRSRPYWGTDIVSPFPPPAPETGDGRAAAPTPDRSEATGRKYWMTTTRRSRAPIAERLLCRPSSATFNQQLRLPPSLRNRTPGPAWLTMNSSTSPSLS